MIVKNRPLLITIFGNIIAFVAGTCMSWSSVLIPKLTDTNLDGNPIGRIITDEESSWLGSLLSLGSVFGPLLVFLSDQIGRKLAILFLGVPFLVSYLILAFADIIELYYVARFIIGLANGGVYAILPLYIVEIAQDSNRGTLSSLMGCFLTAGVFFSYAVGPYIDIMTFNIILAILPGIFLPIFYFVGVESPYYYIRKNDKKSANQSLQLLRNAIENNSKELENITIRVENSLKGHVSDLFKSKGLIKALTTSLLLIIFQQLSGATAILAYSQSIFSAAGGSIKSEISSIIVGVVVFSTSFVAPLFVDRLGRRILLIISAIGMMLSEIPIGLFFHLKDSDNDVDNISWLPVICLVIFIVSYNCGFGILPWTIMGELFPPNVKSTAFTINSATCWFLGFLVTKFFQTLVDAIGIGVLFWIYAGFCFLAFCFTFFWVIETKGKSLQEIQEILQR